MSALPKTFALFGNIPIMRVVEQLHWKGAYVLNLGMEFISPSKWNYIVCSLYVVE